MNFLENFCASYQIPKYLEILLQIEGYDSNLGLKTFFNKDEKDWLDLIKNTGMYYILFANF